MSQWEWTPKRTNGIWKFGSPMLAPFLAAVPYLTVIVLLGMIYLTGKSMAAAKGVTVELADTKIEDGEAAEMVAIIMPKDDGALVFFDDSRYVLGDVQSESALTEHLTERTNRDDSKCLLTLADRKVSNGELMKFAALAKQSGLKKILFAQKRENENE